MAGIHRSSTLRKVEGVSHSLLGMAGIHRSSTLTDFDGKPLVVLGMAGIHRSSTLGRAEPAEKQQVGAVSLFRKEGFALGYLPARVVFCHKRPPFCQTDGP